MRLVIHDYEDGTKYVFETDLNGGFVRTVEGTRKPGARLRAEMEIAFDGDEAGRAAALDALHRATAILGAAA